MKILALVLVIVVVGTGLVFVFRGMGNSSAVPLINDVSQEGKFPGMTGVAKQTVMPEAKLVLVKKGQQGQAVDFDVVYQDGEELGDVQGVQFLINVSPGTINAGSSSVNVNPQLKIAGLNPLIASVGVNQKENRGEIRFMGAKMQPKTQLNLVNGTVLASVHLVFTQVGAFQAKFDSKETKVIYGDVKGVRLTLEEATWTVVK